MRCFAIGSLVLVCVGCSVTPATLPDETAPPIVFLEAEPGSAKPPADDSVWTGVWQEYFPGRPTCQDTFELRVEGTELLITSLDCTDQRPYAISNVRWDGQSLAFTEVSASGTRIEYSLQWVGPGQLTGTADKTEVTWTRSMW